ncbi:MAG: LysM peptidoglycan-binding domain-containing protein [Syntrophaceae bacterium]|nr:LysM peptidoglycan-binding domain-containing protein [Syntrophaceae bacterium]
MKRRIFLISGLFVLLLLCGFSFNAHAVHYKVKKGDTLSSISKKFDISISDIKKVNNLHQSKIKANQILKIGQKKRSSNSVAVKQANSSKRVASRKTNSSYYVVKKGDSLSKIAHKNNIPLKKLVALNHLNSRTIRSGQKIILAKSTSQPQKQTNLSTHKDEDLVEETNEEADTIADENTDTEEAYSNEESLWTSVYRFVSGEEFLGKWESTNEMQRLIKKASGFLGAPYRLGGTSKRGIDCSAFVQKVYRSFNVNLPRVARDQSEVGVTVDIEELAKGDLVFFRTNRSFGHVGIYIGNSEFIHASSKKRRVRIDSLEHPFYQERFQRAVRIKELPIGG